VGYGVSCDSRMPAVTIGARRAPLGLGATRTQHGPRHEITASLGSTLGPLRMG
jgi:hypothetical protein